jgi:hypothetical protein
MRCVPPAAADEARAAGCSLNVLYVNRLGINLVKFDGVYLEGVGQTTQRQIRQVARNASQSCCAFRSAPRRVANGLAQTRHQCLPGRIVRSDIAQHSRSVGLERLRTMRNPELCKYGAREGPTV